MDKISNNILKIEKLSDDSPVSSVYYYYYIYTKYSFDCHGLFVRSNVDTSQYGDILTDKLPFTFNQADLYDDGTYKNTKHSNARGYRLDLLETKTIPAFFQK